MELIVMMCFKVKSLKFQETRFFISVYYYSIYTKYPYSYTYHKMSLLKYHLDRALLHVEACCDSFSIPLPNKEKDKHMQVPISYKLYNLAFHFWILIISCL